MPTFFGKLYLVFINMVENFNDFYRRIDVGLYNLALYISQANNSFVIIVIEY